MSVRFSLRSVDKEALKLLEARQDPGITTVTSAGANVWKSQRGRLRPGSGHQGGSVPGSPQLLPEEVRGGLVQPLGVHNAQVTHVALVGEEQLREHDAGRLAVEEHGGGMDGHWLVGVCGGVGPVRLQLSSAHEEAVRQASADALRVPPGGQDWHGHLVREEVRHGKDPRREHCAATPGTWSHTAYSAAWCKAHRGG